MIMNNINLTGCGTALITPFKNGAVDYDAFAALVDRQVEAGIDFLVPLGTTGETPCLEDDERIKVLQVAKEHSKGLPVVVGGGTNSLNHTIRSMQMLDPYGVDAFLIVVPYYNKPTQEGQYQYFKAVAESTDKPIVLYNVPGRTGANMSAETTLRLAEIDNIVAVKEASGNRTQIEEILRNAPEDFMVLSGNDDDTLWMMQNGGAGIISVASNVAPKQMADFIAAIRKGDMAEAEEMNRMLTPLFTNCFVESNPIPAKAALHAMGLIENELRLPLVPSQQSTYELMVETIKGIGLL
ncbi:MAG: 4-hydroxy-tetrahydrodipicolinate synthase [Bacteroidales bacterium]|nr:4-hydroxy-tetrahydrodipicolinate synthase [Bacteroidales bacterium]